MVFSLGRAKPASELRWGCVRLAWIIAWLPDRIRIEAFIILKMEIFIVEEYWGWISWLGLGEMDQDSFWYLAFSSEKHNCHTGMGSLTENRIELNIMDRTRNIRRRWTSLARLKAGDQTWSTAPPWRQFLNDQMQILNYNPESSGIWLNQESDGANHTCALYLYWRTSGSLKAANKVCVIIFEDALGKKIGMKEVLAKIQDSTILF